jgi:hypothetical protein
VNLVRRIILASFGLGLTVAFVWVPWRGGPSVRGGNTEVMGYGFIWSGPRRPAAFVGYDKNLVEHQKKLAEYDTSFAEYEKKLEDYKKAQPSDWKSGLVGYNQDIRERFALIAPPPSPPQPLKEPEGYSGFPYRRVTSAVDYERLLIEIGALSGLLLVGWVVTMQKEVRQHDPQ